MLLTRIPGRRNYIILIVFWACVQLILLWKNGIVTDGESIKYIHEASVFGDTGTVTSPNYWMYFTQILLITIANKISLGFSFVIAVQLLLNLIATVSFYRYAASFVSPGTALAGTILLLLNYPLQQFNTFLQTESIFYSISIILSCYLLRQTSLSPRNIFIIVLLLLVLGVTRPTGLLFFPAVFLYSFFRFFPAIRFNLKIWIVLAGFAVFLFLLNIALGSGGELDFMLPYRDERIICGVPTLPGFIDIKTSENGNSLYGLLYYIVYNFDQFIRLAFLRFIAFFGMMRSYYSTFHNIYIGVYFFSFYIAVILSWRFWKKNRSYELFYFMCLIVVMCGSVMLTCDDWHNRFYLTIQPYINLLGLPFLSNFMRKSKN